MSGEAEVVDSGSSLLPTPTKVKNKGGRPPKSGAYSGAQLVPLMSAKQKEITAILRGNQVAIGPSDSVAVGLLARALAHIEIIDRYLAVNGFFECDVETGKTVPAPVLKLYYVAVNSAARQCDTLGLTPKSRLALGMGMIQAEDLAGKMAKEREREEG